MNVKPWEEIHQQINAMDFKEPFNMIVAIANGGIIPAALLNQKLQAEFQVLKINFRNQKHQPVHPSPTLLEDIHFDTKGKTLLLVEDRVKTGATLEYAKSLLQTEAKLVKTFAVNGKADYSLFDEACFSFPWLI